MPRRVHRVLQCALECDGMQWSAKESNRMKWNGVRRSAVEWNEMKCAARHCAVMQRDAMCPRGAYLAAFAALGALGGLCYAAHTCKTKCEATCGCGGATEGRADDEEQLLEMTAP